MLLEVGSLIRLAECKEVWVDGVSDIKIVQIDTHKKEYTCWAEEGYTQETHTYNRIEIVITEDLKVVVS